MKKIIKLTESDLNRIVKRIINEQMTLRNAVTQCAMENGTAEDLDSLSDECIELFSGDMSKMIACGKTINAETWKLLKSKIGPITKCAKAKMKQTTTTQG